MISFHVMQNNYSLNSLVDLPLMTCSTFIRTTLDTVELFMPVQLTIVPSRLLFMFIIVMIDTKGSAFCEETLKNVKVVEFITIGVIIGFWLS